MKLQKSILFGIILFMAAPVLAWPRLPVEQSAGTRVPIIGIARTSVRQARNSVLRDSWQAHTIDLPAIGGANRELIKTRGPKNPLAVKEEPTTIFDDLLRMTQIQKSW